MKSRQSSSFELVRTCCRVLDEKKAGELQVLDVGALSSITDFLILATATSNPHLRAMRVDLEKALKVAGIQIMGVETSEESGWTIIDLFDVMIHLFRADVRSHYGLENLWKDATEISVPREVLADSKETGARKRARAIRKPRASRK
jgi:ribosome-associated protein